jgi:hypothetical protein
MMHGVTMKIIKEGTESKLKFVIIWDFNSHTSNYIENSTLCNRRHALIDVRYFPISQTKM